LGDKLSIATAPGRQVKPVIAYNSIDNQYLVIWSCVPNIINGSLCGQIISHEGAPIGDKFPIYTVPGTQLQPAIAYNPADNQYLLVWHDLRGAREVHGQIISKDGVLIGSDFRIAVTPGNQVNPSVTYNSKGHEYLLVWEDWRNFPTNGYDVY